MFARGTPVLLEIRLPSIWTLSAELTVIALKETCDGMGLLLAGGGGRTEDTPCPEA